MKTNNSPANQKRIVIFCGGRGSASIIRELLRKTSNELTLIVNAYDDGLSTGSIRKHVSGMLGPSDFRKNLSYLIDPHSLAQINLKKILEYRIPNHHYKNHFIEYINKKSKTELLKPVIDLMEKLPSTIFIAIKKYLETFFDFEKKINEPFNYTDCSIGNLIFAGAYLKNNNSFNQATREISEAFKSRAKLINVSKGENRVLIALKQNCELLLNEAQIVSQQSSTAIKNIYFFEKYLTSDEIEYLKNLSLDEKETWLNEHEKIPQIAAEAEQAIMNADIIIYGPGTQHSSLYPSYRIANKILNLSKAPIKALIMNLARDHDIQSWSAKDLVDNALRYLNDTNNQQDVITHILVNNHLTDNDWLPSTLTAKPLYKRAEVVFDEFNNPTNTTIHSGISVINCLYSIYDKLMKSNSIDFFIDLNQEFHVVQNDFNEINWKKHFSQVTLTMPANEVSNKTLFPEVKIFFDWLYHKKSEYLVLMTGDGEYHFQDVISAIQILQNSTFCAVFGSRNQSNLQFKSSLLAAYGERKLIRSLSFFAAFFISAIIALRYKIIFSDPLTGLRVFKRSKLKKLTELPRQKMRNASISILKLLIRNHLEIAELPVNYRTFLGFSDPNKRIKRGLKNLFCALT